MKEKLPGKGLILAGGIVALIAGAILLFAGLTQMGDLKEVLGLSGLTDTARNMLKISIWLDPLRGVVAIVAAVFAFVCFASPRKWNTPSMIAAIVCVVTEFAGIMVVAVLSMELGESGKVGYSLGLLGALLVIVGLGNLKKRLREEKANASV